MSIKEILRDFGCLMFGKHCKGEYIVTVVYTNQVGDQLIFKEKYHFGKSSMLKLVDMHKAKNYKFSEFFFNTERFVKEWQFHKDFKGYELIDDNYEMIQMIENHIMNPNGIGVRQYTVYSESSNNYKCLKTSPILETKDNKRFVKVLVGFPKMFVAPVYCMQTPADRYFITIARSYLFGGKNLDSVTNLELDPMIYKVLTRKEKELKESNS